MYEVWVNNRIVLETTDMKTWLQCWQDNLASALVGDGKHEVVAYAKDDKQGIKVTRENINEQDYLAIVNAHANKQLSGSGDDKPSGDALSGDGSIS